MPIRPVSREAPVCFLVALLFAANFCHGNGNNNTVEVVGSGECADCGLANIEPSQAFSGLRVTIDCKLENENGGLKTRGTGKLDVEGKFKVSLPEEIVEDGKLKEECYVQLRSASGTPYPAYDGLKSTKLVFKIETNEKHIFGLAKDRKLMALPRPPQFHVDFCGMTTRYHIPPPPPPAPRPPTHSPSGPRHVRVPRSQRRAGPRVGRSAHSGVNRQRGMLCFPMVSLMF